INAIYLWTSGPQEAVLRVALKRDSGIRLEEFRNRLREELPRMQTRQGTSMRGVELQFESGDIVEQVMSFGSPTPVQVTINGPRAGGNPRPRGGVRAAAARDPLAAGPAVGEERGFPPRRSERGRAARRPGGRARGGGRAGGAPRHAIEPVHHAPLLARPQDRG